MGMKKQAGDSWKQPREKYLSHRMLSKMKKAWLPTPHSHFTLTITCTFCLRHGFLAFCIWPSKTCIGLFFLYFWSLRLSLCISTSFTLLQLSDYWTIDLWLQELFHYNTLVVRTVCSPTPKKKKSCSVNDQWMNCSVHKYFGERFWRYIFSWKESHLFHSCYWYKGWMSSHTLYESFFPNNFLIIIIIFCLGYW